ncbi:FapA family protein [Cupriavidus sp. CV2]|uniref:DUF342 domain-containing protein n=1 Tax=Cupriavidus ulmosensis TaxID=3065913 RepID=UPI00296ADD56|nr:FapA family protein [Cupriavidus sp. CV2]MDW3685224.1 FapA family protein [Cupriavidus sp. CV2]
MEDRGQDTAAGGLQVSLDDSARQLRAAYAVTPGRMAPDRAALQEALAGGGWADAKLDTAAIGTFLAQCQRATEGASVEALIGELTDGYFDLSVSSDNLSVRLNLLPPQGGREVTRDEIRAALAERGVKAEPDSVALRGAVEAGYCDGLEIATGRAPLPGTPARFESLLAPPKPLVAEDESGRIDLRDLGTLLLVNPGTPLMRRIPARQGSDGVDVFGKVVPAVPAADPPFADGLTGVAPDPADPEVLVATISGSPALLAQGASVSPVVDVAAVDMHSGNITFDGTLRVNGDIKTGMTVRVTGDVIVSGTIEAAHVEAGGNVVVKGGIIGKAEGTHQAAQQGADSAVALARVTCKGSVHARFIESAVVEAGTEVKVESGIRQSDVAAGRSIVAGSPKGGQGNITGGRCRAQLAVRTATLGASAGTATTVQVGTNPYAETEKAEVEAQRRQLETEQAKVQQLVSFFAKNPEKAVGDLREKARATLFKLTRDSIALDARLAKLAEQLRPSPEAVIEVSRRIHGGCSLHIGPKSMKIMEDKPGGHIRLVEDRIALV